MDDLLTGIGSLQFNLFLGLIDIASHESILYLSWDALVVMLLLYLQLTCLTIFDALAGEEAAHGGWATPVDASIRVEHIMSLLTLVKLTVNVLIEVLNSLLLVNLVLNRLLHPVLHLLHLICLLHFFQIFGLLLWIVVISWILAIILNIVVHSGIIRVIIGRMDTLYMILNLFLVHWGRLVIDIWAHARVFKLQLLHLGCQLGHILILSIHHLAIIHALTEV